MQVRPIYWLLVRLSAAGCVAGQNGLHSGSFNRFVVASGLDMVLGVSIVLRHAQRIVRLSNQHVVKYF